MAVWLFILFSAPLLLVSQLTARQVSIQSPNQKIKVTLFCQQNSNVDEWYLKASYNDIVDKSSLIEVKMPGRGGFAASLIPLQ